MPDKPRQPAPIESDLLAWIEGEPLAPSARARLDRLFESDPATRDFAHNARSDRDRLRALAGLDESRAPRGMVRAAFEQAERDSLLGPAPRRLDQPGPRRLRITPVRLAAGIAAVILVGVGSIVGLIVTTPTHPQAPIAGQTTPRQESSDPFSQPTLAQAPQTQPKPARSRAAEAVAADAAESASARIAGAGTAVAHPPLPALSVRLIRSAQAGPAGAVSPDRASALALEGRLMVVARAASPAAVERAVLAAAPDTRDLVRWRSIGSLVGGISTDTLPETAPRVLIADVLATPQALEHVVAALTAGDAPALGAWLQEVDEGLRMTPEETESDRAWWTRPPDTWAPRVTVPVLIEFTRENN